MNMTASTPETDAYEPVVYLTNFRGQDMRHARTFGRIKAITKEPIVETFKLDQVTKTVSAALAGSHPEDWLICSGHMVLGIIAAVEFLRRHKRLNLLLWHAKAKKYLPRVLQLRQEAEAAAGAEISADPVLVEMLCNEVPIELA